jgi:hypothetical protein
MVVRGRFHAKACVPEESQRDQNEKESKQELYNPWSFEVLLKGNRGGGYGDQQKTDGKDDQPGALHGLGLWITLPEKCVNTLSTAAGVFPSGIPLSIFHVRSELVEISRLIHLLSPEPNEP